MTIEPTIKGWKTIKLGKCLAVIRNGIQDKQKKVNGEYKITRIETIGHEFLDLNRVQFADNLPIDKIEKFKLRKNDILFSHINSDVHLGKTVLVNRDYEDVLHGMNLLLLKANTEIVDSNFLQLIFKYLRNNGVFIKIASRAVNQSSINQAKLKNLELNIPPLSEQKSIASILTITQEAIAGQEELIVKLRELKQSMMQHLFTHGVKGEKTKMTEIGEIPESWELVELGSVYEFTKKPKGIVVDGLIPFITMDNIPIGQMNVSNFLEKSADKITSGTYVENGDLLLAKITPSFENGKQAILNINNKFAYATTEVIPIKEIKDRSSIVYLFYYLLKNDIRQRLAGKMEGTTGRQRLSKSVLEKILIPFPAYEEQKKIAEVFMVIDRRIESVQEKLLAYDNLFETLLHELMSGERRVKLNNYE